MIAAPVWAERHELGGLQEDATALIASMISKSSAQAANAVMNQPGVKDAISAVTAITVSAAVQTVKEEAAKTVIPALIAGLILGYLVANRK